MIEKDAKVIPSRDELAFKGFYKVLFKNRKNCNVDR